MASLQSKIMEFAIGRMSRSWGDENGADVAARYTLKGSRRYFAARPAAHKASLFGVAAAIVVLLVACLSLSACASESQTQRPEFTTPAQVSELIASLEDGEAASLELVSMSDSQGGSIDAGTHEDELLTSGYERADIGAFEWVNGIKTKLIVPMWYGPDTTIQIEGREPEPMLQAVESMPSLGGPFYWFGDPVVSVEFHMEQEVLVLDSAVVPNTP